MPCWDDGAETPAEAESDEDRCGRVGRMMPKLSRRTRRGAGRVGATAVADAVPAPAWPDATTLDADAPARRRRRTGGSGCLPQRGGGGGGGGRSASGVGALGVGAKEAAAAVRGPSAAAMIDAAARTAAGIGPDEDKVGAEAEACLRDGSANGIGWARACTSGPCVAYRFGRPGGGGRRASCTTGTWPGSRASWSLTGTACTGPGSRRPAGSSYAGPTRSATSRRLHSGPDRRWRSGACTGT